MKSHVHGLNGANHYLGTILTGLREVGPDLVEVRVAVLVVHEPRFADSKEKLFRQAGELIQELEAEGVYLEQSNCLFGVRVIGADHNRKFSWQPSEYYDADKAVVQELLACAGTFR